MLRKFIFPLAIISSSALAQNTTTEGSDPLQQILDKLDSMEQRLGNLENANQPAEGKTTPNANNTTVSSKPNNTITTSTASQKNELVSGMVIKIKHANTRIDQWFTRGVSTEHFAGYVTTSSEITTSDIYKKTLGYRGAYALAVEGYFNANEKGTYNFGVIHQKSKSGPNTKCMSTISLNGTVLVESRGHLLKYDSGEERNMLVNGSVSLEPGIYEYAVFSVCNDHESNSEINRTFLVKTPSDLSMRPMTDKDILHKK